MDEGFVGGACGVGDFGDAVSGDGNLTAPLTAAFWVGASAAPKTAPVSRSAAVWRRREWRRRECRRFARRRRGEGTAASTNLDSASIVEKCGCNPGTDLAAVTSGSVASMDSAPHRWCSSVRLDVTSKSASATVCQPGLVGSEFAALTPHQTVLRTLM